jgi:hypothetical protein
VADAACAWRRLIALILSRRSGRDMPAMTIACVEMCMSFSAFISSLTLWAVWREVEKLKRDAARQARPPVVPPGRPCPRCGKPVRR